MVRGRVQPQLGRFGLFTLMAVAKAHADGTRGRVACAVLRKVQWHYRNVTLFYRAELRLKFDVLVNAGQLMRPQRHAAYVAPKAAAPSQASHPETPRTDVAPVDTCNAETAEGEGDAGGDGEPPTRPDPRMQFIQWHDPAAAERAGGITRRPWPSGASTQGRGLPGRVLRNAGTGRGEGPRPAVGSP